MLRFTTGEEIWRTGSQLSSSLKTTQARVREVEAVGCRFGFGQTDAAGCSVKKVVKPARCRDIAMSLQQGYGINERKSCITLLARSTYRYQS